MVKILILEPGWTNLLALVESILLRVLQIYTVYIVHAWRHRIVTNMNLLVAVLILF